MKRFAALFAMTASFCAGDVAAQDWNVDVFAGATSENELEWFGGDFDTDAGRVFGLGVSRSDVVAPGLELGLEYSTSESVYSTSDPNSISGTALMATARYTVVTTGGVEAYGGLGLGGVRVTFDNENAGYSKSETVGGGQVMIGARYAVTPRSKVFVEARKLDTFEDAAVAEQNGPATAEYDATHVLFGFRQSF